MLQDNNYYIMIIIFDGKKYILPLVLGTDPKFNFDEEIHKELKYEDMEKKYMEILIYYLPSNFDVFSNGKLENLLKFANLYSGYKIDLLTIAVGPENHNMILLNNNIPNIKLGRISYTIRCTHVEKINIIIKKINVELAHLFQTEVSIRFKYRDDRNILNSKYTLGIEPHLQLKDKKTFFEYDNNNKNPLTLNIISSMLELVSADASLNLYSVQLIDTSLIPKSSIQRKHSNEFREEDNFFERNPEFKNETNISNIKLINRYTLFGFSTINFLNILSENEEEMNKRASKLFRQVSGLNKNIIEDEDEDENSKFFKIQIFLSLSNHYTLPLFFNGEEIGKCHLHITIENIPLIRQIMSGVITENGFEVNSIHLYNINIPKNQNDTLPKDLKTLVDLKNNLNSELVKYKQIQLRGTNDLNNKLLKILKEIKNTLNKSIEDKYRYLYYGYSSNADLFFGQSVMLDLGRILIDVVDKFNKEPKEETVQILKILNQRSEFDLGTLTTKWFNENKNINFINDDIIKRKLIQNFLDFNYECLNYSLDTVSRGKSADEQSKFFSGYFLSVVYFRIPIFREIFLEIISQGVNEDNELFYSKKRKSSIYHSSQELMEMDPINNLILWEHLFYDKLNYSFEKGSNKYNEEYNEIKKKLDKIENLLKSSKQEKGRISWKERLSRKDFTFFTMINNLIEYILFEGEGTNEVNWLNIPGFDIILNALLHEINVRHVKVFPKELINLFPLLINNINVVNEFIKTITYKTNANDVQEVFNLIDIIDSVFKKFHSKNPNLTFAKYDYNTLSQAMVITIKTDHSLCVAKFILLYYNNVHLMPMEHVGQICNSVFISKFYDLFFHWSYEVRDKFYYFILYIIGFRLRSKSPFQDMEDLALISGNKTLLENYHLKKSFGDILLKNLTVIEEIQNIVNKENFDLDFNNKINPIKFGDLLKDIPPERYKNILVSLSQYNPIYKNYEKWAKLNANKKENEVEYPTLILIPPKDDVVEYEK